MGDTRKAHSPDTTSRWRADYVHKAITSKRIYCTRRTWLRAMSRRRFILSITGQGKPKHHQVGNFYMRQFAANNCVSVADLTGASRTRTLARLRQEAYAYVRAHTDLSLGEIGNVFGGRDHTTILHGIAASEARS